MHLKYKMREEKSNIKVPVAVCMLNHTRRGGEIQTRRFRNVELLSMGSFTEPGADHGVHQ